MIRFRFLFPLLIFLIIGSFLWKGLKRDPHLIPSPLLNKPMPSFEMKRLEDNTLITNKDLIGRVTLLNFFATWCLSCQEEHDALMKVSKIKNIQIIGVDYKDDPVLARKWLVKYGNPYVLIIQDSQGLLAIDLGVYGTPETFVIDQKGIIRYKYVGPLDEKMWDATLRSQIKQLQES